VLAGGERYPEDFVQPTLRQLEKKNRLFPPFIFPKRIKLFLTESNSLFLLKELQAAFELQEEKYAKTEGQNLTVRCPFNIMMYFYSQKAWQRLQDTGEPLTLAITEKSSGNPSQVQVGKYTLKDDPSEAMLYVQMTNLQVEDSGLYRCVIYHPPADPIILFRPVRLVVTKGE
jgi:triggering receptor expressed on myeloid cells 1